MSSVHVSVLSAKQVSCSLHFNGPRLNSRGLRHRLLVGALTSGFLFWCCLRGQHGPIVIRAFNNVSGWSIVFAVGLLWLSIPLRVLQTQLLLAQNAPASLLLRIVVLSNLFNLILPMRGGEVVKVCLMKKFGNIPIPQAALSTLIFRLQDIPPIILACLMVSAQHQVSAEAMGIAPALKLYLSGGVILVVLCSAAALFFLRRKETWLSRICRGRCVELWKSRKLLPSVQRLVLAQFIALNCWVLFVLSAVPLLHEIIDVSWRQCIATAATMAIGATAASLIPAAPGGIGTIHAATILALSVCCPDIQAEKALAFAITSHAIGVIGPALPALVTEPLWILRQKSRTRITLNPTLGSSQSC